MIRRQDLFRPRSQRDGVHEWNGDHVDCPVPRFGKRHRHQMQCYRCGTYRYGAYHEQGKYHFFEYDHANGRLHELLPACVQSLPENLILKTVHCCNFCNCVVFKKRRQCNKCGVKAGTYELQAVCKKAAQ